MNLIMIFNLIQIIENNKEFKLSKNSKALLYITTTYNNLIKKHKIKYDFYYKIRSKKNKFITLTRSWKDYIFFDNFTFENDVLEMYTKYNCAVIEDINSKYDIEDVYKIEPLNTKLRIYDINRLFQKEYVKQRLNLKLTQNYHAKMKQNENCKIKIFQNVLSLEFAKLFCILENDFFCLLENLQKHIYVNNTYIRNIIINYKTINNYKDRLSYFLDINLKLLYTHIGDIQPISSNKKKLIKRILFNAYGINKPLGTIDNKLYYNRRLFKMAIHDKKLTYCEILTYCIEIINKLGDKLMHKLCVIGANNLFNNSLKIYIPKHISILIFLYSFINERNNFNIEWHKRFCRLLVNSRQVKNPGFFNRLFFTIFREEIFLIDYKIYIFLNSNNIISDLDNYNKLCANHNNLQIINYIIDLVNMTKCKLLGISFNSNTLQ